MNRVIHGGYAMFRQIAPWIEEAVPQENVQILTRGAIGLPVPAERYWFYNTEPLHVGGKFEQLRPYLDGAERVFDYSERNHEIYPRGEFCPPELGNLRLPGRYTDTIDILFYGLLTERRNRILDTLEPVICLSSTYGDELWRKVRSAKIVLCINAYDSVNANPFRAFPAIQNGGRLVVEATSEQWYNEAVAPYATIVSVNTIVETCERILRQ